MKHTDNASTLANQMPDVAQLELMYPDKPIFVRLLSDIVNDLNNHEFGRLREWSQCLYWTGGEAALTWSVRMWEMLAIQAEKLRVHAQRQLEEHLRCPAPAREEGRSPGERKRQPGRKRKPAVEANK